MRRANTAALPLLLAACTSACINSEVHRYETRVHGPVDVAGSDPGGSLHLVAHNATRNVGADDVEHPLGPFDEWSIAGRQVDEVLTVPMDGTEGLVLFAWIDADGDGELCAPGADPEPSGLVVLDEFPAHDIAFALTLDTTCEGPEALYP